MSTVRLFLLVVLMFAPSFLMAWSKGIYITQPTLQHSGKIKQLILQAKASGIDTFVIDAAYKNSRYERNIKLVHNAGIKYVARIVVFPGGGAHHQINNKKIWEEKLRLAKYAVGLGADEIQLDYIRYNVRVRSSDNNAEKIRSIIHWFEKELEPTGVKLQVAVFGETSFGPSRTIGQNIKLFAPHVDVLNPMVYPSHYEPHSFYGYRPYLTIKKSMDSLLGQFDGELPFKLIPYIEVTNYRRPMNISTRVNYIREQIRAARDGGADGWYAWSPNNKYEALFRALEPNR